MTAELIVGKQYLIEHKSYTKAGRLERISWNRGMFKLAFIEAEKQILFFVDLRDIEDGKVKFSEM